MEFKIAGQSKKEHLIFIVNDATALNQITELNKDEQKYVVSRRPRIIKLSIYQISQ